MHRMIPPAPTTEISPALSRGTFAGEVAATATKPGYIKVTFPNNYELHLIPDGPVTAQLGKRLVGEIHSQARRIDESQTGGRFVEPLYGRPRRIQGSIVAVDAKMNTLLVNAGVPIHVTPTDARQKAADFTVGQFVVFDVPAGSTFTQKQ